MDLNRLSLFIRIVETRSFTRAAAELGKTTSSVSRALMRLEQELGVRLLQRTTRKLSLTAVGRAYFDQVRGALARVEEASTSAHAMGEEPRGVVRVTAPPSLASSLIPMVAGFLREYPKIRVELSFFQRTIDLIEEGFDLAIRVGRLGDSSLIARRVGNLRGGLFASREYVRRRGQPQRLADLAKHDCVLFRGQDGKAILRLLDGEREHRVEVTGPFTVDEIPAAHQAVLAGVGIGPISFFVSARMRGLVRILPKYATADIPVSLVSPSKRLEPASVVLMRDFLAAKLTRLSWRG
ncbi:MAG: LysR family transcriptional regulator [Candidatus Binataceae bacterium]